MIDQKCSKMPYQIPKREEEVVQLCKNDIYQQ